MEQLEQLAGAEKTSFVPEKSSKLLNLRGEKYNKLVKAGEGYFLYQGSDAAIAPVCYEDAVETIYFYSTDKWYKCFTKAFKKYMNTWIKEKEM